MNIQQLPPILYLSTGSHTDSHILVLLSAWTVQLRLALNFDISNYSKTVSFRFQHTVMQSQLVVWAGLPFSGAKVSHIPELLVPLELVLQLSN